MLIRFLNRHNPQITCYEWRMSTVLMVPVAAWRSLLSLTFSSPGRTVLVALIPAQVSFELCPKVKKRSWSNREFSWSGVIEHIDDGEYESKKAASEFSSKLPDVVSASTPYFGTIGIKKGRATRKLSTKIFLFSAYPYSVFIFSNHILLQTWVRVSTR